MPHRTTSYRLLPVLALVAVVGGCGHHTAATDTPTTVATAAHAVPAAQRADEYAGGAPLLRDLTVPAGSAPAQPAQVATEGAGQAGYATLLLKEGTSADQVIQALVEEATRAGYQEVGREGASVRLERTAGDRLRRLDLSGGDRTDDVLGHVSVVLVDGVAP